MRTYFFSFLLVSLSLVLSWDTAYAQNSKNKVSLISFAQLEKTIQGAGLDTLLILNFWATWCKPCVEEMPHFEKIASEYKGKKVKLILISLDYSTHIDKVQGFMDKKNIRSKVYILNESNPNTYIDKVHKEWSGAIPATLLVGGKCSEKVFQEKSFSYAELETFIKPYIP